MTLHRILTAFATLLLCCAHTALAAEPEEQARALANAALAGEAQAYEIVGSLTTEVGQRLAGTQAEVRAARWAAAKMTEIGLANVRIERFPYQAWVRTHERARVISPVPHNLVLTALGDSVSTPKGGLEAALVLVDSYEALEAAAPDAFKGKIVLVTQATPRAHDGGGYGAMVRIRTTGAIEAAKRGAVGYLIRSIGTQSRRFPHTGTQRTDPDVPAIPAAALSPPDVMLLERLALASDGPIRVHLDIGTQFPGDTGSQNVIGEIIGSERPDEIILISAHLDSWDLGTGALDDGAGVGIVLGVAKLIKDAGLTPGRTIRVVLYGAEEQGLVGAYAYAERYKDALANHVIGTEADFGQGPIYALTTRVADPMHPTIVAIARAMAPLGIYKGHNRAFGGPDMRPLLEAGMPVATLAKDGADYFDYHHTPDDTFDKIAPARINQTTAAYAIYTWLMAELGGDFRAAAPEAAPQTLAN